MTCLLHNASRRSVHATVRTGDMLQFLAATVDDEESIREEAESHGLQIGLDGIEALDAMRALALPCYAIGPIADDHC